MIFATTAISGLIPREKSGAPPSADGSFLGVTKADMDETKFDWVDAAQDGHVLLDYPARKVAVFANQSGEVVVVSEHDGVESVVALELEEALHMVAMLRDAIDDAAPISRRVGAEFAAFQLIQKAQGA